MKRLMSLTVALVLYAGGALSEDTAGSNGSTHWLDTTDDWGRPWGDAASSFYRRLEVHRQWFAEEGTDAARMQFAVGTEISLRKVFRPKVWFKGDMSGRVSIDAARGESEAFQLVVLPIADGERDIGYLSDDKTHGNGPLLETTVHIEAVTPSPLRHVETGHEIPVAQFAIYRVGYIGTVPGQYPVVHVGEWPDPLLPFEEFDVSNPFCQPVWVEVRVPPDAPAGAYEGSVTVRGPHDIEIRMRLNVWDFALSDPPQAFTMGWALNGWFLEGGIDAFLPRLDALLDHRVAPWYAAEKYRDDLAAFDRVASRLWERGVPIQAVGKPQPELYQHLEGKGWLDRFVCIWGDEPHDRDYPEYRSRADEIRRDCPGLAVAMTEDPRPDNIGLFDVWIPEPSFQNDQWVRNALERGDRVWWYLCQLPIHAEYPGPIHACPGMVVDRPAIDHRITYWLAFRQNIEGVAYWAISSWPEDFADWPAQPWPPNPLSKFPYSGQHNGNGFICYPGTDGLPWPSIRLKCIRDGLEDHDYLTLLARLAGPDPAPAVRSLLEVPPELAMDLRYYNKDPEALLRARRGVAEQILRLTSAR